MSSQSCLCRLALLASLTIAAPLWGQNKLLVSCPASANAGAKVSCQVSLSLQSGVQADSVDFTVSVSPTAGVATYTDTLGGGLSTKSTTYASLLYSGIGPISGLTVIGSLGFTIPANAAGGTTYTASFTGAEVSYQGTDVAPVLDFSSTSSVSVAIVLAISTPTPGTAQSNAALTPQATSGRVYTQTFTATGGTAPYTSWTVNSNSLPNGLGISKNGSGQGVITGTPTISGTTPSTFNNIDVTVTDSASGTASGYYSLVVNPAISGVTPTTLPSGTVGAVYASGNISVTGGTGPYRFATTANLANYGLTLSAGPAAAATITGTASSGVSNLSIPLTVTDVNGATGGGTVTLTITGIAITAPAAGALPNGTVNLTYNAPNGISIASAGGTGAITWTLSAGTLPPGLTLGMTGANNGTATITGAPTGPITTPVTSTFTVKATDSNSISATRQYSITVYAAPSLTAATLPVATVGSAYSVASATLFSFTGGAPTVTWSATGLPNGVSISSSTGALSGTPASGTNTNTGPATTNTPDNITIKVTDANGATASVTPTLTVDPALAITTASPLPAATQGSAYTPPATPSGPPATFTMAGSGGNGTYTWSSTTLPANLSISSAGVISGIPSAAGTISNVSITLTDSTGASVSKTFSITVNAAISVTTASPLPAGTVNAAYSPQSPVTLAATGGTGTLKWSSSTLPTGLSISSAGVISGSPTATGTTSSISITATDINGATGSKSFSLTVNQAPTLGGGPLPLATVALAYTSSGASALTVSNGTAPFTWSATPSTLPPGLSINSGTGVISGTPTTATGSPFSVAVTVKDVNNATASMSFPITVDPAITITPVPGALAVGIPGVAYRSITFVGAGGGGGPYTLAANGVPTGLTFTPGTGVLSGTPSASAKSFNTITISVTDGTNTTATFTYTLAVAPPLSISGPASLPAGTVGVGYNATTVTATGGTAPYGWSATGLPPGLTIGSSSGTISGAPTAIAGSPYAVKVTVTDANGTTASANFSITVGALPLTIVTGLLPTGVLNAPYPYTSIRATGGVGTYIWSVTGLPPGLTTDGNGDISGTPTSVVGSPFSVVASVTDATLTTKTATYSLTISNALTIAVPLTLPSAALNTAYAPVTVIAGGGLPPYTWSATGLPSGLSIAAATGTISGTPTTAAGTPYSITVTVTDSRGVTASMPYTLAVNSPLSISGPAALPSGTVGAAYPSTTVTASGGSGVYTWSATGLPSGLSIAATTGAITGTPGAGTAGSASVVVTVTDSSSNTATKSYSLTINPGPSIAPVISTASASTEGQGFIAPNTWLSIYGSNFAAAGFTDTWTQSIKSSSTGALPILLDGVSVMVGGVPAYVSYLSATQINVLTANIGFGPLQVTVTTSGGTSNAVTITAQQNIPGFFELPNAAGLTPGDSTQQPTATHQDYSVAVANGTYPGTTTVPAKPGETIILWGSGFGPTTPTIPFGVGIPTTPTFSTQNPVSVSINGAPATVYQNDAFLASGNAGLFQLGVTVPASLPNGSYSITTTVGGVTSAPLTLVVHN